MAPSNTLSSEQLKISTLDRRMKIETLINRERGVMHYDQRQYPALRQGGLFDVLSPVFGGSSLMFTTEASLAHGAHAKAAWASGMNMRETTSTNRILWR